jgi:hypothetical protein
MIALYKYLTLFYLSIIIIGCNSTEKNNKIENKKESSIEREVMKNDSTMTLQKQEIEIKNEISEFDVFFNKKIFFYLSHPEIPSVCKEIFLNKRKISDDNEVLALMDSIFTRDNETRPFYFLTLTRTMEKADGAYAEPLGIMSKKFVENHTKEFLDYFINEPLLSQNDFKEWALTVIGEIKIVAEKNERKEFESLKTIMTNNCSECNLKQEEKLNEFLKLIENHCP